MLPRRALAVALCCALAACGGKGKKQPSAAEGCALVPAGPRGYDAQAYALSATWSWDAPGANGPGRLDAVEELTLALCPGATQPIVLDAGVTVTAVSAGGQALAFTQDPVAETLSVNLGALASSTAALTLTIAYTAGASDALAPTSSTADDPVQSRVVFTDSEPRQGHRWLVEKDDPSDPALFSVTLEVGPGEDVIANGERVVDVPIAGGGRRIGYALDVPIATYLMAFAAGELDHVERTYVSAAAGGRPVPLALWYRRGLSIVPARNLDAVEQAMAVLEDRLGPYPFARYSTVLLPAPFGGGMENATITFNGERSGQGWVDFGLNAHELAHQWFGDWVTMRTYDDVWVKEGMATLLAAEASRPARDVEARGRLMGTDFAFDPADAIVDPTLTGIDKYTSGPYQRAASLVTQVRALVGEQAFWSSCRAFLAAHAKGSATGEDFLRAFRPGLGTAELSTALARLPAFDVPGIGVSTAAAADGTDVTFTVSDPGHALLVPLRPAVVDAAGAAAAQPVIPGTPRTLRVPAQGYLARDELDVHPYGDATALNALLVPPDATGAAGQAFLTRSAGHQERALLRAIGAMAPADLPGILAALDSREARRYALRRACARFGGLSAEWNAALVAALSAPPVDRYDANLQVRCPAAVGAAFEAELVALAAAPGPADLARLEYLISFPTGAPGLAAIRALSTGAPSLELRSLALSRLSLEPAFHGGAAAADEAEGVVDEGKATRGPGRAAR